jgi:hypothetical protein
MNTAAATRDFPEWMGPMLIKELRQGMKAKMFEISFVGLQVVLVLVVGYHALLYSTHGDKFSPTGLHAIFWLIVAAQLLVITPLRALVGISSERKANTLELIYMTGLTSWRIAFGKWASLQFQSLLFVLSVLPYALLRYFFGEVNLTEDLTTLGFALLASGLLTAVTLAISAMPLFFRIAGIAIISFGALSFLPALMFSIFFSGAMMSFGIGSGFGDYWWLLVYDLVLIGLAALGFTAALIAPIAENHALRHRLIALATLLPVPVLHLLGADEGMLVAQLTFFATFALVVSWVQLSAEPPELRVQVEPFSRRGPLMFAAGLPLQPGWPGAMLFLVIVEVILISLAGTIGLGTWNESTAFRAVFLMAGAALLTPVIYWRLLRRNARQVLIEQSLILIICSLPMIYIAVLNEGASSSIGDSLWPALIPPFGFWAMMDGGLDRGSSFGWQVAAGCVFVAQFVILVPLARPHWRRLIEFHRDIQGARKSSPAIPGAAAA